MSRLLHISEHEIAYQAGAIFDIVSKGESGLIVCYPGCKIDYNLAVFLDSASLKRTYLGKHHNRFVWVRVPLGKHSTVDDLPAAVRAEMVRVGIEVGDNLTLIDLVRVVEKSGRELYVFLIENEAVPDIVLGEILNKMQFLAMSHSRVGAVLFTERNIHDTGMSRMLAAYAVFFQNIRYFPVYTNDEIMYFLKTLAQDFGLYMPDELIGEIARRCGGYLWLLRGVVRRLLNITEPVLAMEDIYASSMVQLRVSAILRQFTTAELQCLQLVTEGNTSKLPRMALQFLISTGVIVQTSEGYSLASQLIQEQLEQQSETSGLRVTSEGRVVFEGAVIDTSFSERELAVVKCLLDKRGMVVSREELAQVIWGSEWGEAYSDWALDKVMSRVRKGLRVCGLPSGVIETKKGRGFLVR